MRLPIELKATRPFFGFRNEDEEGLLFFARIPCPFSLRLDRISIGCETEVKLSS